MLAATSSRCIIGTSRSPLQYFVASSIVKSSARPMATNHARSYCQVRISEPLRPCSMKRNRVHGRYSLEGSSPVLKYARRHYQDQASTSEQHSKPPAAKIDDSERIKTPAKAEGEDPLRLDIVQNKTDKQQRETDWRIIKKLLPHIWPKGDRGTKTRVILALGLLIGGKLLNVQVPFFFKNIVDQLHDAASQPLDITSPSTVYVVAGASILGCECAMKEM